MEYIELHECTGKLYACKNQLHISDHKMIWTF